jgi:hypothetical protein
MFIFITTRHKRTNERSKEHKQKDIMYDNNEHIVMIEIFSYKILYDKYSNNEKHRVLHRIDGPAMILYHNNGNIRSETWYRNGNKHRPDDYPAYTTYTSTGDIWLETGYNDGDLTYMM